jgi:hypothetical protein
MGLQGWLSMVDFTKMQNEFVLTLPIFARIFISHRVVSSLQPSVLFAAACAL